MNLRLHKEFFDALHSPDAVSGLTHTFYRYPARFSPLFAQAAIRAFTKPGDTVFDPFMGGGTTLVEASALGRRCIGTDINSLAVFISRVKTTPLSEGDLLAVHSWTAEIMDTVNMRKPPVRAIDWADLGYQRNISGKSTWPIRKAAELILANLGSLDTEEQRQFARCALLKTAQWALDCRTHIPPVKQFRGQFLRYLKEMMDGARDYADTLRRLGFRTDRFEHPLSLCVHRPVAGIEGEVKLAGFFPPRLILTSPPYPGVHVLYHRWQVRGRKETPAPFWITNTVDGNGASFYTFGDRKRRDLGPYYDNLRAAFSSLARIADENTLLVQLVAFSDPAWQLTTYLNVMEEAGFKEMAPQGAANSSDGRVWRRVPNRKWYALQKESQATAKEVVLFHRLA